MGETATQPQQAQPMKLSSWLLVGLAILWCWLVAWSSTHGRYSFVDPYVLGGAIGMSLFPLLIAYALRGRKKKRDWNSFARWFVGLALVLPGLQFSLRSSQEAADRKAEREFGRQFIREMTALQDRYSSDARCEFDPPLYSSASFATRRSMEGSIDQLDACLSLYEEMQVETEDLIKRMEATMSSSFSSAEYREDVLRRFREGLKEGSAQRQLAVAARKRWEEETRALYEFSLHFAEQIQVKNNEIIINNSSVLAEFNRMLKNATEAQDELTSVETRIQEAGRYKMKELDKMVR